MAAKILKLVGLMIVMTVLWVFILMLLIAAPRRDEIGYYVCTALMLIALSLYTYNLIKIPVWELCNKYKETKVKE